ncbi:hypothetical protein [Terasakiella pusilla]|uniref:hypothetical protein n=1 Tax=Terasakiella pusilla TaxID=64973 RepID=UPI003AA82169
MHNVTFSLSQESRLDGLTVNIFKRDFSLLKRFSLSSTYPKEQVLEAGQYWVEYRDQLGKRILRDLPVPDQKEFNITIKDPSFEKRQRSKRTIELDSSPRTNLRAMSYLITDLSLESDTFARQLEKSPSANDYNIRFFETHPKKKLTLRLTEEKVHIQLQQAPGELILHVNQTLQQDSSAEAKLLFLQLQNDAEEEGERFQSPLFGMPFYGDRGINRRFVLPLSFSPESLYGQAAYMRSKNPKINVLMSYLNANETINVKHALVDEDLKILIRGKLRDPVAAAMAAYAMLSSKQPDDLDKESGWLFPWTKNLSRWFHWLPDGCIIHGELLALYGDHKKAFSFLNTAVERGLPFMRKGLSILYRRLRQYTLYDTDGIDPKEAKQLLLKISPHTFYLDPAFMGLSLDQSFVTEERELCLFDKNEGWQTLSETYDPKAEPDTSYQF